MKYFVSLICLCFLFSLGSCTEKQKENVPVTKLENQNSKNVNNTNEPSKNGSQEVLNVADDMPKDFTRPKGKTLAANDIEAFLPTAINGSKKSPTALYTSEDDGVLITSASCNYKLKDGVAAVLTIIDYGEKGYIRDMEFFVKIPKEERTITRKIGIDNSIGYVSYNKEAVTMNVNGLFYNRIGIKVDFYGVKSADYKAEDFISKINLKSLKEKIS